MKKMSKNQAKVTAKQFAEAQINQSNRNDEANSLIVDPPTPHPPMNEQTLTPPSYLWSRIERILDEQDSAVAISNSIINASLVKPADKTPLLFAALGMTVIGCVYFIVS